MSKENNINEEVNREVEIDVKGYIEKLQEDLKVQKEKTDEYYEHLQRNMAEFDNYKKRISKEKSMVYLNATSEIIEEILPVMDNFEKAINTECKTDTSFKDGVVMIYGQLKDFLNKLNVKEIETVGTTFNPELHEAVMHEEDNSRGEKEVVEVFRKGYIIDDKVIRHAMVKVAN